MSEHSDILRQLKSALGLAANTSSLIEWEQLSQALDTAPAPLTDRERARLLVHIANDKALRPGQLNQLVGLRVLGAPEGEVLELPIRHRKAIAACLDAVIEGSAKERADWSSALAEGVSRQVLLSPSWVNGTWRHRLVASDIGGALQYSLSLFLEGDQPSKAYGRELCRCKYSKCEKYFFKVRGDGAPSRTYCSAAHQEPGELERARERMAKLRKGRK